MSIAAAGCYEGAGDPAVESVGGSTSGSVVSDTAEGPADGGTGSDGGNASPGSTSVGGTEGGDPAGDDDDDDDDGDGDDGGSEAGDAACPASQCVVAPPGWNGPVRITEGATEPGCGGEFPDDAFVGFRDLEAPPAACTCTCDDPLFVSCAQPQYNQSAVPVCPNPTTSVLQTDCINLFASTQRLAIEQNGLTVDGGCLPSSGQSIADPSWGTTVSMCEGPDADGTCDDPQARCLPAVDEGSLCVYQMGALDCSDAGEFTVAQPLVYDDYEDTRACEACACSDPVGTCVIGAVRLHGSPSCIGSSTLVGVNDTDECLTLEAGAVQSVRVVNVQPAPGASCNPNGGGPVGSAEPLEPVTVCCRP